MAGTPARREMIARLADWDLLGFFFPIVGECFFTAALTFFC
jgi:hypothetical protein